MSFLSTLLGLLHGQLQDWNWFWEQLQYKHYFVKFRWTIEDCTGVSRMLTCSLYPPDLTPHSAVSSMGHSNLDHKITFAVSMSEKHNTVSLDIQCTVHWHSQHSSTQVKVWHTANTTLRIPTVIRGQWCMLVHIFEHTAEWKFCGEVRDDSFLSSLVRVLHLLCMSSLTILRLVPITNWNYF